MKNIPISYEPRITGGSSIHPTYDPEKCPKTTTVESVKRERCGSARCVDCCGQKEDNDIDECSKCGFQRMVSCYFDEEYS